MLLIADSGSSKTDWKLLDNGKATGEFTTSGLNPVILSSESILFELNNNEALKNVREKIRQVYFYGAGCSNPLINKKVLSPLTTFFNNAKIHVDNDLLAAALATCGDQPGIVCILGTGSNACYFDGKKIVENNFGMGYVLADEGGGSDLGKQLITAYLYGKIPPDLINEFEKVYKINKAVVINHVYNEPKANTWLASFVTFLHEHKHHPYLKKIIEDRFEEFFNLYVYSFPNYNILPVNCIGSIAFLFEENLRVVVNKKKLELNKILQKPINGLVDYFLEKK